MASVVVPAVDLTSHCSGAVKCSRRAGASLPDNFCGIEYAEAAPSSASVLVVGHVTDTLTAERDV